MAGTRGRVDPEADYEESSKSTKARKSSNPTKPKKRETRQTRPRTPIKGKAETIVLSSTSDDGANGATPSPRGTSRKRKSILQPKGSKYSKKATGRRQTFRTDNVDFGEDEDEDVVMEEISPLATVAPRANNIDRSAPKYSSALDDYASHHKYLPRKHTEVKLVSYQIPSTEPQGPGDMWTCTFEGCRQRVHAASTSEGKERIKVHFKEHADAAQEKIELAYKEARPYLPVE